MPAVPGFLPVQPLLVLLAVLGVGIGYAAWFGRTRAAWGFAWLLWLTAGTLAGTLWIELGFEPAARLGPIIWQLLPWNLLLLAVLPDRPLRSSSTVAVLVLLAIQLLAPIFYLQRVDGPPPLLNEQLLALVPVAARDWLTPIEPVLAVIAAVIAFARWQRSEELTEFGLFVMATMLLVAIMLPGYSAVAVTASALVLLGALVVNAHRMAFMDALTGLPNRRALEGALGALPARYAIAMVDIDHFKSINDRFGHDVGDQVLRMTGARLRAVRGCRAFRYGGEEFCLLFRGRHAAGARAVCEEARQTIADPPMVIRGPQRPKRRPLKRGQSKDNHAGIKVTASLGIAFPRTGDRPSQTIEAADRALYRSKKGGRNKVTAVGKPAS
ncbi:MAG: GGDEF domain-containing protein [Pseudomonadota bacterium]